MLKLHEVTDPFRTINRPSGPIRSSAEGRANPQKEGQGDAHVVTARFCHAMLCSVAQICGPQYKNILLRSGLGRFRNHFPPVTDQPCATIEEVGALFAQVRQTLGPNLSLLFYRNFGRELSRRMLPRSHLNEVLATMIDEPPMTRLLLIMQLFDQRSNQDIGISLRSELQPDGYSILCSFNPCPYCYNMQAMSSQPICQMTTEFYHIITHLVTGFYGVITETECAAVSGNHACRFLISVSGSSR